MSQIKNEVLEKFLEEATIVEKYFIRKIKDKSITTHLEKSMAERYIKSLRDLLEKDSNEKK